MADQPTTPSGSRWEPDHDEIPTETPTDQVSETRGESAIPPGAEVPTPEPSAGVGADQRRAQLRGRAILAGAATALTLGGGLTGFVIGHSTTGDDSNGFRPATNSFQQDGSGQQPGDGQEGQQRPPVVRHQDGDGNGFGGPPGFDDDSSGGSTGNTGDET